MNYTPPPPREAAAAYPPAVWRRQAGPNSCRPHRPTVRGDAFEILLVTS